MGTRHIVGHESIKRRVERGLHISSLPLGYVAIINDGKKLVIPHPIEKEIVTDAFKLFAYDGLSMSAIALLLQKKYNRVIYSSLVHRILHNQFYNGIVSFKGGEFPHNYPRFIDQELWDKTQERLSTIKRKHQVNDTSRFLFRRLIRCDICSSFLSAEMQKGHVYYACKPKKIPHDVKYVREEKILEQVKPVAALTNIDMDLLDTYEAMSFFFSMVFSYVHSRHGVLIYELFDPIPRMTISNRLKEIKNAKKEPIKQYKTHEIPQLIVDICQIPSSLEEIVAGVNKRLNKEYSFTDIQLIVMDVVIDGRITEELDGRYVAL